MYSNHNHCRACGFGKAGASGIKAANNETLLEAFDLGIQPLANDFTSPDEPKSGYAPLKVLYCPRCSLAQLSVVVDPAVLYRHYSYVTSPSAMMRNHFERLLDDIQSETDSKDVLEIGSNDGKLLSFLRGHDYKVLGVDPAANLAKIAEANGVPTHVGFFSEDVSRVIPHSSIVIARHVFCHVDDWQDFVRGLEGVTEPHSIVCLEVPYVGDMLAQCEFDTVYHEHLSYLSINALRSLLLNTKLYLYRVIEYEIHGGAVLLMLRRKECGKPEHPSVGKFNENLTMIEWNAFSQEAHSQINRLRNTVRAFVAQGKRVAGLGASAKSTVWVNACGFTRKDINFIADNTPQKQWKLSPGTDIPICDEGAILRELPDYVVMWAWNYREEILNKFSLAREKGVKFIIPVPKIEVV